MKHPFLILCLLAAAATPVCADDNLLSNGSFESGDKFWQAGGRRTAIEIVEEGQNHFLSLRNEEAGVGPFLAQTVKVEPGQWLEFTGRMRVKSIESDGGAKWHNARVQLTWKDASNKDMAPWPPSPDADKPTGDWITFRKIFRVPPGAVSLKVEPSLFYARGDVSYDELVLKVISETEVPENLRKKTP